MSIPYFGLIRHPPPPLPTQKNKTHIHRCLDRKLKVLGKLACTLIEKELRAS